MSPGLVRKRSTRQYGLRPAKKTNACQCGHLWLAQKQTHVNTPACRLPKSIRMSVRPPAACRRNQRAQKKRHADLSACKKGGRNRKKAAHAASVSPCNQSRRSPPAHCPRGRRRHFYAQSSPQNASPAVRAGIPCGLLYRLSDPARHHQCGRTRHGHIPPGGGILRVGGRRHGDGARRRCEKTRRLAVGVLGPLRPCRTVVGD